MGSIRRQRASKKQDSHGTDLASMLFNNVVQQKDKTDESYGLLDDTYFTLASEDQPGPQQDANELSFRYFVEKLSHDPHLGQVRAQLETLESREPLSKPTPEHHLRRAENKLAHSLVCNDSKKWLPQIYRQTRMEQLHFEQPYGESKNNTSSLSAHFKPFGTFEQQLQHAIQKSGLEKKSVEQNIPLAAPSIRDAAQHQRLAKLRSLLFHQHRRAKRLGKIKSKAWRRIYRKTELQEREKLLNLLEEESPELAQQIRHKIDEKRAMMRMLKQQHSRRKWAEMALRFGGSKMQKVVSREHQKYADEKEAVNRIVRSRPKTSMESDTSDSEMSDSSGTEDLQHTKASSRNPVSPVLKKVQRSVDKALNGSKEEFQDVNENQSTLLNLPFMKRALEKQKQHNESLAQETLEQFQTIHDRFNSEADSDGENSCPDPPFEGRKSGALEKKRLPEIPQELLKQAGRKKKKNDPHLSLCSTTSTQPPSPKVESFENTSIQQSVAEAVNSLLDSMETTGGTQHSLNQEALVKEAFILNSQNIEEFNQHVEEMQDKDQDEETHPQGGENKRGSWKKNSLPGWGSWTGEGVAKKRSGPSTTKGEKEQVNRKVSLAGKIYINRRIDPKVARYLVKSLPFPYNTEDQFKVSHRHPLGPEWNTLQVHERLIEPEVHVRPGTIITPLEYAKHCPGDVLDSLLDAWTNAGVNKKKIPKARL